ncbi:integrase catalytic domain-containing protein [Trichonephila clavipes]|nr:integrase catalytic domain-containing protein [Trichonephila clavipes]
MKILLQELWKLNLEWDEPIPEDLNKQWTTFRKELHLIEKMKIPRCVLLPSYIQLEIHAFCDSSVRAYCTAIYLKCIASESISVSLLTSKTRVTPLKTQSLPRLEHCAALLLSNVLQVVLREFPLSIHRTIAWTDSTITLAWLKTEPYRWQPFVANRVSKIQTTIPSVEWCHVSGIENPADLGTRGLLPSQLVAHDQWIHGPLWLNQPMNETSSYKIPETFSFPDNALKEKRSVVTCVAKIVLLSEFIDRISSFTKLVRVCAWILRFIKNSHSPVSRTFGYLKSSELHTAVVTIVRLIQQAEFPNEFKCLFQGNPLPKDNKLLPLNLFCDSEGVLRVGGRLSRNTRLSYDQKHPMLLPKSHEFTRKISSSSYTQKVSNLLQDESEIFSQLMGDLPPIRFQQIRPFASTGLDFAGPLTTKCAHKRSVTKFKSYICLFICTATKAVHLELVSDLSTAAFLAALRRFIARRSCPSKIISDNGSNFKGASSHLRKLVDLCLQEEVQNFLSLKGIEWSFIPPYTPHFGGLWESAIKSAKQLLIKATNSVLLNFEECSTLLIQIEACLNSRPLTELSPDPSDFTALTPAHFLVGGPIHQFPEPSQPSRSVPLSERWNLIQRLRQYFWDRWSTEYLHRLQPRSKWWRTKPNLQLGDMVIVEKEKNCSIKLDSWSN